MHEQTYGKAANQLAQHTGWFNWAEQHPGFVVLGALVVAFLAFKSSPKREDIEPSAVDEEVPLFI